MSNAYYVEIQLRSGEKKNLTASARPDFDGDYFYAPMGEGYFAVLLNELVYVHTTPIYPSEKEAP